METEVQTAYEPRETMQQKGPSAKWFWIFWIVLIGLGTTAAYLYSNHLQEQAIVKLQEDTRQQMAQFKAEYEARFGELVLEINDLQSKVQSFNELLTFTKDQATGTTDNSNKLYSQLSEVEKQLKELERKMELLK
ncbi:MULTISPECIES: hypothetical protein [Paenibacillus]|uniref:Uncharacterized protein n=1 Tax=Paenibacillus campinasensis TaxID=66347 RepID=A0A268EPF9_9BACL|nr:MULTISPECIES: hypothetical protein [Paenibacillus]MUG66113.1 hypothetical protein [Paenibacillus campinasensis]PAD75002.1 hypothetical protein CHH67_16845 [Paenibacillus campinasensis]PAK50085.1 hypothetical protein CHH75_18925 [Paenibacillus sp. 7541]